MLDLAKNRKEMTWSKLGINFNSNIEYKEISFEKIKVVISKDIRGYRSILENHLLIIKNLDFGDSIDLNLYLYENFKGRYLNHYIFKVISYRINYLKCDVASNAIILIEEFNYRRLGILRNSFYEKLNKAQNVLIDSQSSVITGLNWGQLNKEFFLAFGAQLYIYEQVLDKIDFYIKFNGLNPDNPNKKDWPIFPQTVDQICKKLNKKTIIHSTINQSNVIQNTSITNNYIINLEAQSISNATPNDATKETQFDGITVNETINTSLKIRQIISFEKLQILFLRLSKYNLSTAHIRPILSIKEDDIPSFINTFFNFGNYEYDAKDIPFTINVTASVWTVLFYDFIMLGYIDKKQNLKALAMILWSKSKFYNNKKIKLNTFESYLYESEKRDSVEKVPLEIINNL
jgi:hypothetical protein